MLLKKKKKIGCDGLDDLESYCYEGPAMMQVMCGRESRWTTTKMFHIR